MPSKMLTRFNIQNACLTRRWTGFFAMASITLWSATLFAQWPMRGGPNGNYRINQASLVGSGVGWSTRLGVSDSESIVDGDSVILVAADYADSGLDATRLLCLDRLNGGTKWDVLYADNSYVTQDISDRYPVRPIATPYLSEDSVVCIGYGGSVRCLNKIDGTTRWAFDLVKDYGAEPVQFGFATSPWGDGKQVLIACGGPAGTILSIDLATGKKNWGCGTGQPSYCSFVEFSLSDGTVQIVYAAQDELLAVDPNTGMIEWQYPFPKQGLTNAVTPIAVDKGTLLVAGQGVDGTRLLKVEREAKGKYHVGEVWQSSKQQPFYCNWIQLQANRNLVVGFASKTLFTLDWTNGKIQSQVRGWTDCNLVATPDGAIAVRGDGYIGKLDFKNGKPIQVAGYGRIRDRVWCAPTVSHGSLFVRGRTALHCVPLSQLLTDEPMRNGTAITSMDAMYGTPTEAIEELTEKLKYSVQSFTWDDYVEKVSDESVPIGEGTYLQILKILSASQRDELALQIATDWANRQPLSIRAFEAKAILLRNLGREAEALVEEKNRLVEVEFIAATSNKLPPDGNLILIGNSSSLGNWDNPGLKLRRESDTIWRAKAIIPRGDLQFKVAGGRAENTETLADGRKISNRRFRVQSPCEIRVDVEAFKEAN